MEKSNITPIIALKNARESLRLKRTKEALHWAKVLTEISPDQEEGWLILAAYSSPKDSVRFLIKALEVNPGSERARQGMDWAIKRLRKENQIKQTSATSSPLEEQKQIIHPKSEPTRQPQTTSRRFLLVGGLLLLTLIIFGAWLMFPTIETVFAKQPLANRPVGAIQKFTITPTATSTATSTATATSTSTPTSTPTNTPTATATPTYTSTPTATSTPRPTLVSNYGAVIPEEVNENTRWIDIDLSDQMLYAYIGDTVVNSFLVSTGTWQTPTVIGEYHVYVKYRFTDMRGPGYYLKDVPYTMYFYKGYGIHGTFWHDNFGTPMSHGCVNMRTSEAEWLYNFASVGTLVNVHP
ncbi:MAG TPA: L,D-transpeptidase [Anaerolineaceae bacterium]|nr:L,D-transpeptidase [Anaerolineaceae bacterium]